MEVDEELILWSPVVAGPATPIPPGAPKKVVPEKEKELYEAVDRLVFTPQAPKKERRRKRMEVVEEIELDYVGDCPNAPSCTRVRPRPYPLYTRSLML